MKRAIKEFINIKSDLNADSAQMPDSFLNINSNSTIDDYLNIRQNNLSAYKNNIHSAVSGITLHQQPEKFQIIAFTIKLNLLLIRMAK
ncbi:hypothetical protein ACTC6A_001531 [Escherichia albertii]